MNGLRSREGFQRRFRRIIVAAPLLALATFGSTARVGAEAQTRLAVAGRRSAYVSLASAEGVMVAAWGASDATGRTDVYTAVSLDGGTTFAEPVKVNGPDHPASLSGEQPARVAIARPRGSGPLQMVVVWNSRSTSGMRLYAAASEDGGRSFGSEHLVSGTDAPGNRGWASVAALADGRVLAAWLDHRDTAANSHAAAGHAAHAVTSSDPTARAQLSAIWIGDALGGAPPVRLAQGVCYCCKTTIAATQDGTVHVGWRHVYEGSERDVAVATSRDGGRRFMEPTRVSRDHWVIDGCPEDGPSLASGRDGRLHVVWPTLVGAGASRSAGLFYATAGPEGNFGKRQQIPTDGVPRHPVVITAGASLVAAWDEGSGGQRTVAWGIWNELDGPTTMRSGKVEGERGVYPAIAAIGGRVLVAFAAGPPGASYIAIHPIVVPAGAAKTTAR